jgi:hypothetical protein
MSKSTGIYANVQVSGFPLLLALRGLLILSRTAEVLSSYCTSDLPFEKWMEILIPSIKRAFLFFASSVQFNYFIAACL